MPSQESQGARPAETESSAENQPAASGQMQLEAAAARTSKTLSSAAIRELHRALWPLRETPWQSLTREMAAPVRALITPENREAVKRFFLVRREFCLPLAEDLALSPRELAGYHKLEAFEQQRLYRIFRPFEAAWESVEARWRPQSASQPDEALDLLAVMARAEREHAGRLGIVLDKLLSLAEHLDLAAGKAPPTEAVDLILRLAALADLPEIKRALEERLNALPEPAQPARDVLAAALRPQELFAGLSFVTGHLPSFRDSPNPVVLPGPTAVAEPDFQDKGGMPAVRIEMPRASREFDPARDTVENEIVDLFECYAGAEGRVRSDPMYRVVAPSLRAAITPETHDAAKRFLLRPNLWVPLAGVLSVSSAELDDHFGRLAAGLSAARQPRNLCSLAELPPKWNVISETSANGQSFSFGLLGAMNGMSREWWRIYRLFGPFDYYHRMADRFIQAGRRQNALEILGIVAVEEVGNPSRLEQSLGKISRLLESPPMSHGELRVELGLVGQILFGISRFDNGAWWLSDAFETAPLDSRAFKLMRSALRGHSDKALDQLTLECCTDLGLSPERRSALSGLLEKSRPSGQSRLERCLARLARPEPSSSPALLGYFSPLHGIPGAVLGDKLARFFERSLTRFAERGMPEIEQIAEHHQRLAPRIPANAFFLMHDLAGGRRALLRKIDRLYAAIERDSSSPDEKRAMKFDLLRHAAGFQKLARSLQHNVRDMLGVWRLSGVSGAGRLVELLAALEAYEFVAPALQWGITRWQRCGESGRWGAAPGCSYGFIDRTRPRHALNPSGPERAAAEFRERLPVGLALKLYYDHQKQSAAECLGSLQLLEREWGGIEWLVTYLASQRIRPFVDPHSRRRANQGIQELTAEILPVLDPPDYSRWRGWRYDLNEPAVKAQCAPLGAEQLESWKENFVEPAELCTWRVREPEPGRFALWFTDDAQVLFKAGKYPIGGKVACTSYEAGGYYNKGLLSFVADAHLKAAFVLDLQRCGARLRAAILAGELDGAAQARAAGALLEASIARKIVKLGSTEEGAAVLLLQPTLLGYRTSNKADKDGDPRLEGALTAVVRRRLAERLGAVLAGAAAPGRAGLTVRIPASRSPGGQIENYDGRSWRASWHGPYSLQAGLLRAE